MVCVKSLIKKLIQWDRTIGDPGIETARSIASRNYASGAGKMSIRKVIAPVLLVFLLLNVACKYIVLPEGLEFQGASGEDSMGWSALATAIGKSDRGDLHIDITIRNGTGDWSAMNAADDKPAVLTSEGESISCETVFVSTGGHRLAPGFQMRGYTAGTKSEPMSQPIYVECAGAEASPGSTLSIPYSYVTGQYNYYEQDKNRVDDRLEIDLDTVTADLDYPVFEEVDGLIQEPGIEIEALNKVILTLTGVQRLDGGLQFTWNTTNPGEYPSYVHIGMPPVIGDDGVLYGYYETPDIVSAPITPAADEAEWTTEVLVPENVGGMYILLSVETGKARLFTNYAVDISGQ
jgi:hypothetical protein